MLELLRALPPVDVADLLGTWHIQLTNFPMWLAGDKLRPTLAYRRIGDDRRIGDLVSYTTRAGTQKQIAGYDTQDASNTAHFTWRGRGLLMLLSSDWYVVHLDASFGAIYFEKTLFTPAGMDVISRAETPSPAALEPAIATTRAVLALGVAGAALQPVSK
jgi:hypothetical protein